MKSGMFAIVLALFGHAVLRADEPLDYTKPRTPPAPTPEWVKLVDQGQYNPRLRGCLAPEGVKAEVLAETGVVGDASALAFADDGTLFLLQRKQPRDVLVVLHFDKEKYTYDKARTVLEREQLSSFFLHDGWIYYGAGAKLSRSRQANPDGPYDVTEDVAHGFGGAVCGLSLGNDGRLYVSAGAGDHRVEGRDGSRATVLHSGAIFRCRPDGSRMEVYSFGTCNPRGGLAFDAAFHAFHTDNDVPDQGKFTGCRLLHVVETGDYGWRGRSGPKRLVPDPVRGAVYGELPGKLAPLCKTGPGEHAGLLIYNESRFPAPYRGLLYSPDAAGKEVHAYKVEPIGSGFTVLEEFSFFKSTEGAFRPRQITNGPDGAMYVLADRLYRLSWAGTGNDPALPLRNLDSWSRFARLDDAELIKDLSDPDCSDRRHAQWELVRRGDKNRAALIRLLDSSEASAPARLAALGALEMLWNDEVQAAFLRSLDDPEADVRRLAADGLARNARSGDEKVADALLKSLADTDLSVRRSVVLAMGRLGGPSTADDLVNAFAFDESHDAYLHDALLRAIERRGKEGIDRLLALAESGDQKNCDKVAEAFRALRTRPAAEALPDLLGSPHLNDEQRANLLRSYANYLLDPPLSLKPLEEWLAAHPDASAAEKQAVREVLELKK